MDVEHALRRAGRPAGVSDEERVFAVERFRVEASGLRRDELLPPDVPPLVPRRRVVPEPGPHQDALDAHDVVRGTICDLLHRHRTTTPHRAVRGDQHLRARVRQSRGDGFGTEPAEDRDPDRAQLGARHDRGHGLDRHRHEDAHRIAFPDPERSQPMRQPVRQLAELPIGDPADVAVLGLPHDRDRLGGSIGPDVDALMRHVGLPPGEPRRPLDTAGRVEDLVVRRQERDPQVTDHGVPEPRDVADGPRHQLLVRLDPVGAHEPGHVRAFHVLGRRGPHDVLHADTV